MGIGVESIILQLSYFGIFLLMILNGLFSSPSSQILYIIVGYFAATGNLNFWVAVLVGGIGNTIGNILLYELTLKKGIKYVMRFNVLPKKEIKKTEIAFRKKGAWFAFFGKLLPAIKVLVPIIAAIGKMNRVLFAGVMLISSWIWASIFIGIGYAFGKSAKVFEIYAPIVLIISFFVMWMFYRYINSKEVIDELEK